VKEEVRNLINLINRIYEVLHNDGDVVNSTEVQTATTQAEDGSVRRIAPGE